ncbi:MAG: VWA domain-containing protein [Patescibacteria group bacterium]|nr:VWA domain-containing protein [Patescibacteria group bacterium]
MSRERGGIELLVLAVVALASIMLVGGPFKINNSIPPNQGQEYVPITPTPGDINQSNDTLQLKTFDFKGCSGTVTVDFLLDRTGSMGDLTPTRQTKISRLKQAVLDLTGKLDDNAVVGIQSFSSVKITNDVEVSYYKDVKTLIVNQVNSYSANGQTPTHDALVNSYNVLKNAITRFPSRKFNFILISDGQPVPDSQDPRLFNPNPADEIKALGVNIFTLGVYDGKGQANDPKLAELLKSIASKPENYYEAQSADQIDNLLKSISTKLCDSPATPAPTAQPVANPPANPGQPAQPLPSIAPGPAGTCGIAAQKYGYINPCGQNGCSIDGAVTSASECCPGVGASAFCVNGTIPGQPNKCASDVNFWCDAKPVIYLYPEKPTRVWVEVTIPGEITVSIPKYEESQGWKDVLAYPDGTLIYQGKTYSELFYETMQERTTPPENGWVVKTSDLKGKLTEITSALGLNRREQNEFLAYWFPRLNSLNKPYVFVSFFDPLIKDSIDRVDITPTPNNFIQFIMYFKGLDKNRKVNPPNYPLIPQRTGFTAVEWGGILDY